jgi:septal ring factor EnvC (AmiA/AmiB activator)
MLQITIIKWAVVALSLIGCFGYVAYLKKEVAKLEAEKVTINTKLSVSESSNKSLSDAIKEQNAAITKLKTDADERDKKTQLLLAKAQKSSDIHNRLSADLLKRKPPANVPICKSADDLINEAIRNEKPN